MGLFIVVIVFSCLLPSCLLYTLIGPDTGKKLEDRAKEEEENWV